MSRSRKKQAAFDSLFDAQWPMAPDVAEPSTNASRIKGADELIDERPCVSPPSTANLRHHSDCCGAGRLWPRPRGRNSASSSTSCANSQQRDVARVELLELI
jgi:hypothetical protein